jgi:hypothetical protein
MWVGRMYCNYVATYFVPPDCWHRHRAKDGAVGKTSSKLFNTTLEKCTQVPTVEHPTLPAALSEDIKYRGKVLKPTTAG